MKVGILSALDIEKRATEILDQFARDSGSPVEAPVPIERIIDETLDVRVVWDSIPNVGERQAAGAFVQPTATRAAHIILNEDLLDTEFMWNPGLERTTLAHEAGHAVLHQDSSRRHQLTLDMSLVEHAEKASAQRPTTLDALGAARNMRGPTGDEEWREWQAFTFMRFILMPRSVLANHLVGDAILSWKGPGGLYDVRNRLGVTISALVVHLDRLGLIHVDGQRRIHDRRPVGRGQRQFII